MIKGFILAAGFSKRLRPITEHIPKPLLPITGEVLLDYIFNFLRSSGVDEIGINLHYKADEIESYIKKNKFFFKIFHEKEILDTGGALYNARDFLKDDNFIVHNADIYWDGNIKDALDWHINSGNAITLIVHNHPPDNKLIVDSNGNLLGISLKHSAFKPHSVAFTGAAVYNSQVLELLPEGSSSVIDMWVKAINKGLKVKVFYAKYSFWFDIGTPVEYTRAVFDKLKRHFTSIYVHPTSSGCELIDTDGNIVIERDVKIKKPLKGKNLIILPETELSLNNERISDCIIIKDFFIPVTGWQKRQENLTAGGSTRRYFRKQNKIFCEWEKVSDEFEKTVYIGKFLRKNGFPVPEIINVNRNKKLIVFEDLGNLTLYSWLQCRRKDEEIIEIYKKIIENIVNLHWKISLEASGMPIPEFDYKYLRWESEYFLKECVVEVFKVKPPDLEEELNLIAEKLSRSKKVLLHRDLQSQNIILNKGMVYIIDYQSARLGPAGYDVASLLWDPYFNLKKGMRQRLVKFYIERASAFNIRPKIFIEELSLCRLQRHMQALGAYGFLSLKKGKKNFLKFIPSALDLLQQDIEDCYIELPRLKELVLKLKNLVDKGF